MAEVAGPGEEGSVGPSAAAGQRASSGQAEGLSFSVPRGMPVPPSLRNIHAELGTDMPAALLPRPVRAAASSSPHAAHAPPLHCVACFNQSESTDRPSHFPLAVSQMRT